MIVKRDNLLNELKIRRNNGMIKIITGMRRCGKSFLLFNLFSEALMAEGVKKDHIIKINLEDRRLKNLRDPDELLHYIDAQIVDQDMFYILLDEVQLVNEFEDVLNSYLHVPNADVFVTGSNAKFLSKDVITEFRGRGDEIRIHPFSFSEFLSTKDINNYHDKLFLEYMTYGGLPQVVLMETEKEKKSYLHNLFVHTYLKDIKERYNIKLDNDLEDLVNFLASSIGGLTNPHKIANTFKSVKGSSITQDTVKHYLDYLEDAFLIEKSLRYDIKGKHYIDTPSKFYFEDLGLRNARLNFRQIEETHLMENLIYSELRRWDLSVDVGEVEIKALDEMSFNIEKGEFVVILGASGAGKTTILNILGGMDNATMGDVIIDNKNIARFNDKELCEYRRNDIGFVFQFYNLVQNLTAKENVELALQICKDPLDPMETLRLVGLSDRVDNFPSQLSGGEQQRVAIARAVAKNPKLLLCDEPTGALDYQTGKQVLKVLQDMAFKEKMTIVIVTHNSALADMGNKVIRVRSGKVESVKLNKKPKSAEDIEY